MRSGTNQAFRPSSMEHLDTEAIDVSRKECMRSPGACDIQSNARTYPTVVGASIVTFECKYGGCIEILKLGASYVSEAAAKERANPGAPKAEEHVVISHANLNDRPPLNMLKKQAKDAYGEAKSKCPRPCSASMGCYQKGDDVMVIASCPEEDEQCDEVVVLILNGAKDAFSDDV